MQAIALQDMGNMLLKKEDGGTYPVKGDYARYHKKINIKVKFNIIFLQKSTFMFIFADKSTWTT